MSYDDFCRCTPSEFQAAIRARRQWEEGREHTRWESLRWAASATIQPHIRGRANPKEIMPLPWDDAPERPKLRPRKVSKEEQRGRFAALMDRKNEN